MGQTTRSQGISFTHEMWARIEVRCEQLKLGRSRYFQMLVENDLHYLPEIHAHKSDGKWHFYPEEESSRNPALRAAEDSDGRDADARGRRRRRN